MVAIWFEGREEEKRLKHYSSWDQILLVGEGDFSFSLSLARAFGSGFNIVPTSLDTEDLVVAKYARGGSNLRALKNMGTTLLHGIDATKMMSHTDLRMRTFDRIVFNFPHAGFKSREDDPWMIDLHRGLVQRFFNNAKHLLHPRGEVHVTHKTYLPYCNWNIIELALMHSLRLVDSPKFNIEDYPGYNNKRGDGSRRDEQFTLGECCTFMFAYEKKPLEAVSNLCSSFFERSLPDRNVRPLRYPQNACSFSLESCFPRALYANDYSFSERIDPYQRDNLGGYIAEPPREFKGVQETYRNQWSDCLRKRPMGRVREPEGFPPYISQALPPPSGPSPPLSVGQVYFSENVQEPLKDFQPFPPQTMHVTPTREAEVLQPYGQMLGRGGPWY